MRSKKIKVTAGILLSGVLISSVLAGCTGGTGTDNEIPLDVDMENKPELTICLQSAGMTDEELNAEVTKDVIKSFSGYDVDYTQLPSLDDTTALNLAFVNRTQYHAIKVTKAQYNMLLANDALLDIKPALEIYGQDMLENISEYSWSVVSHDGGIYGIPEGGPPTDGQINVEDTIVFREDLLMDEGFDLPETRDEFVEILRYFKNKYGANDSSYRPLTFTYEDYLIPQIAVSFGIEQEWMEVDGEWKFYLELPEYKEYMEFMIGLYEEGLIDLDAQTQDKAKAIAKFGQGKSVAIALSVWDMNTLKNSLVSNGQVTSSEADYALGVIKGLAGTDGTGKDKLFHGGGYSYVTVIPKYMYEEAAYTIDYLNSKINTDNFKLMMIGEENVHYVVNNGEYHVLDSALFESEKNAASYFATGIDELHYPDYFLCRIDSQTVVKEAFTYLNENADEDAVYNPLNFTPYLEYYDNIRITLETYASEQAMNLMFTLCSTDTYDTVLQKWYNDGGTTAKAEIQAWCNENWSY